MVKPRVIATLLVRDEADIVLECIEHHLRHGVDGFIITDNNSEDGSDEICRKHPACLKFIRERDKSFHQARWVTRMAQKAVELGANWVLNLDADEFWYGADKLGDMPTGINEIVLYKKYTHIITAPIEYGPFRRSWTPYTPVPPDHGNKGKTMHRAHRRVLVAPGNHRVSGPWRKSGVISDEGLDDFFFHHYPTRSYKRYALKCRNAGSMKRGKKIVLPCKHWDAAWHQHLNGTTLEGYQSMIYSDEEIKEGLANGKFVFFSPDDETPLPTVVEGSGSTAGCETTGTSTEST